MEKRLDTSAEEDTGWPYRLNQWICHNVEGMMNDLISRKALCDYALNQKDKSVTPNDIMRFPSAQPEQRWIPCSERLPEERGFYLTTTKDKAVYCDYWNEDNFDRTEMVIAWMPLPEPYREERTEE